MKSQKFQLGQKAKDKITGFEGVLTGVARYLTGCDQYCVQPNAKDGAYVEGKWFDEGRLEIVGVGINQKEVLAEYNGADFPAPMK